jgi:hypothetical protein
VVREVRKANLSRVISLFAFSGSALASRFIDGIS